MKAQDYLRQIKTLDEKINTDMELLEQYEAYATKSTSVLGGERVQTSASPDKMENMVIDIAELRTLIKEEIDRLISYKEDARKLIISACDKDCIMLLRKRFLGELNPITKEIEYKTWEEIAVDMGYTYQWVSGGLLKRALEQLQKKLDENAKS